MVTIGNSDLDRPRSTMTEDSGYEADNNSTMSSRRSGLSTRVDDVPSMNDDDDDDGNYPRPVQVIRTDEDNHTFSLDEDALATILLRPDVARKKVAVISVAGAFRKGKSFLLNFFLRYMQKYKQNGDWLGQNNVNLEGFSWRGGCERETSGILLWSEPFFVNLPTGEEVVVLLMDTQGAFDSQSTVKDCATVFALSTMISSVQIYNLSQNIQEDDLQHLQLFTEYGRLALESSEAKPFQSLTFLVRDWSFPYEAGYGFVGGERVLERRLKVSDKQHYELQQLRHHIKAFFSDITCFLMPHPGLKVATSAEFKGQLHEVEQEFKEQLKNLVPRLLAPEALVLKEINGQKVTGRDLMEYFRAYIKIFQGEELPEPKSMLLATAEANNLAAVANAKADYVRSMEEVCGGDTPYMAPPELDAYHEKHRNQAIKLFQDTRKMGGDEFSGKFLAKLDEELWETYENFVKVNNGKNLFRSARTPAVFFVILIILYVSQEIFQMFGLEVLGKICGLTLGLILFVLCFWAYTRYSGSFREVGQAIDEVAAQISERVISPVSNYAMREGVKHAVNISQKLNDGNLQRSTSSASRASSARGGSGNKKRN